jgi:multidrug efflux system outer membrane protein
MWPNAEWWQGFGSSELSKLIASARANNLNLAEVTARVMQSHAQTTIQRAALFPQLNLQAEGLRAGGTESIINQDAVTGNAFGLSVGASYEVDVWGLARDNLKSAQETLKSARYAQQAEALTVIANVASQYFTVLALRKRIAIANEEVAAFNGILETIQLRVSTGTSSHLDLAQEQAQLEAAKAEIPMLEEQEGESRITLAVLLGRPPENFDVEAQSTDAVHAPLVEAGLPSDLLVRRPDVAQAEANLASAHANVDAARAAFLPQFALIGNSGFASTALNALLHGPSFAWDFGGTLIQTIFDGGKLVGQKQLALVTQEELVASYQAAVISAYADVESAMVQVTNDVRSKGHLEREVTAAREAFEISQLQYRQGTTDFITVLQAQATLYSAEDELAQTELARLQGVVHLYEALGGGWIERREERTQ